jgi:hypothetical protein
MRMADIPLPDDDVSARATEAAATYCSAALMQHNHRSYLWSAALGVQLGISFDAELLYVAAMLHDVGLVAEFDNARLSFEEAGGLVAWMFAAGAGWPAGRRARLAEVIVRHMWDRVDPDLDPEGFLLEVGTGGRPICGRRCGSRTRDSTSPTSSSPASPTRLRASRPAQRHGGTSDGQHPRPSWAGRHPRAGRDVTEPSSLAAQPPQRVRPSQRSSGPASTAWASRSAASLSRWAPSSSA